MNDQSNPTNPDANVAETSAAMSNTPASDSAGIAELGTPAATSPAVDEVQENAFRGVVTVIEGLIRQIENHIPRAAQLLKQASDDISARWK